MRIAYIILCAIIISGCTNTNRNSKIEESAGNLKAEIENVYDFFVNMNTTLPQYAAQGWCKTHQSWDYEDNGPHGYFVKTDNENTFIRIISMKDRFYSARIFGSTHEEICQSLIEIFGTPFRTQTINGGEYSQWKTDKDVEVAVEKGGISSVITFESKKTY